MTSFFTLSGVLLSVASLMILVFSLVSSFVYISRKKFTYWEKLGVAQPKEVSLLFGNTKDAVLQRIHFGVLCRRLYNELDGLRFGGFYNFTKPILLLRDPVLIKAVLVENFSHFHDRHDAKLLNEHLDPLTCHLVNLSGQRWKNIRAKLTPTFSPAKLRSMYGIMTDCAEEVNKYLSNAIDGACNGKDVQDVKRLMAKYMTDVTGACVFGIRCNTIRDEDSEFDRMWRRIVTPCFRTRMRNLLRTLCPSLIPVLRLTSHGRTADQFFKIVLKEAVESRKSSGQQRNDFLRLIIDLQAEERNRLQTNGHQVLKTKAADEREQTASNGNVPEPLFTDTVVAANAYVFFTGGYETNINTLIYCLYELALNPEICKKLRNEVDSVKETNGGVLTFEATKELVYLDAVISETLRKYPPIGIMQRQCTESFRIPDSSFIVEKGTQVFIPVYGLHHDPIYFPEPEKFIPERFIEKQSIIPYTYLPFGDGPRICIGMRFAQLQMMTVLCNIISNYTVHPCERTVIPVKYDARATFLSPEGGIWLRFQRRSNP